jgi:hypothetical protein
MSGSSNLPIGWDNRNNQMSEHDIMLGGDAANKFSSSSNVYQDNDTIEYQNSEQVKAFYMNKIAQEEAAAAAATKDDTSSSTTPIGWESRQAQRDVQAKQFGVFAKNSNNNNAPPPTTIPRSNTSSSNEHMNAVTRSRRRPPEAMLVNVAVHSLNAMSECLEQQNPNNNVVLTAEERVAFASAMQRAMNVIAKCK